MTTGQTVLLLIAYLAAPVCLLAGVGAGAFMTWRMTRGQSPLPSLFAKKSRIVEQARPDKDKDAKPKPPRVAA